jgi:putative tryptophan/tyrosine transport system substrate-binding protein
MRRREFIAALGTVAAWPLGARAQQADRIATIGILRVSSAPQIPERFSDDPYGFRDLGYIEGRNIRFEIRFANGDADRLAALARELVDLKVDVIVTAGPGVYAAHSATTSIPIVMASGGDLIAQGLAVSLAHPGGNITGSAYFAPELLAKRLELLKEIVPPLTRAGVLMFQGLQSNRLSMDAMTPAARALNVELLPIEVVGPSGYEDAFAAASIASIGGLVITDPGQFLGNAALIVSLVNKRGLPAVAAPVFAAAGALVGYGVDFPELWRHAATFVDKILKGAKPGDIPIEQATRFTTVVNLKTAKALGIEIPALLLAQADEVIE